ncbi:MAG: class I SAM-dependent methyltransferase [Planctomycetes bacterium]|nr:class I SAM-dependent methyltransferase [Planctomycetota bacterium]
MLGLRRGPHVTRYFMYRHLGSVGSRLPQRAGRALAIGQSTNLCEVLGLRPTEVVEANYPEHNILSLDMPDASFDYLLSDQVLEHVAGDPQRAVDECSRVLRPGGVAVHTTCFINPIHGGPDDFWRFTPYALSLLHRQWSEVVDVGGWGNPDVWSVIRDGLRYVGVPHAKWHPLHRLATRNDPLWPVVTWIVARK